MKLRPPSLERARSRFNNTDSTSGGGDSLVGRESAPKRGLRKNIGAIGSS